MPSKKGDGPRRLTLPRREGSKSADRNPTENKTIDHGAQVAADPATHQVRIEPTVSDRTQLRHAGREADDTPIPIADAEMAVGQPASRSGWCCR